MSDGESPASEAELNHALGSLLRAAHDNGVDVEGGWECRNGPDRPDWDVIISQVEKDSGVD